MADPVPIVRTFMSSPQVTCSCPVYAAISNVWKVTCFTLWILFDDLTTSQARIETRCSGDPRISCKAMQGDARRGDWFSGDHRRGLQELAETVGRSGWGGQGEPPKFFALHMVGIFFNFVRWTKLTSKLRLLTRWKPQKKEHFRIKVTVAQIILNKLDLVGSEEAIKVKANSWKNVRKVWGKWFKFVALLRQATFGWIPWGAHQRNQQVRQDCASGEGTSQGRHFPPFSNNPLVGVQEVRAQQFHSVASWSLAFVLSQYSSCLPDVRALRHPSSWLLQSTLAAKIIVETSDLAARFPHEHVRIFATSSMKTLRKMPRQPFELMFHNLFVYNIIYNIYIYSVNFIQHIMTGTFQSEGTCQVFAWQLSWLRTATREGWGWVIAWAIWLVLWPTHPVPLLSSLATFWGSIQPLSTSWIPFDSWPSLQTLPGLCDFCWGEKGGTLSEILEPCRYQLCQSHW